MHPANKKLRALLVVTPLATILSNGVLAQDPTSSTSIPTMTKVLLNTKQNNNCARLDNGRVKQSTPEQCSNQGNKYLFFSYLSGGIVTKYIK
jgi:tartrate dehydratase beta subunit/fumarate hydratase class I family protein